MKSQAEWLETDGLGGFASGAADGIRTRRYHALLLAAMRPPTERFVLVNGVQRRHHISLVRWWAVARQTSNWPTGRMSSTRFLCGTAILWSL